MSNIVASVTKHLTFDASHFLINYDWDAEQNLKVFHNCSIYKEKTEDGFLMEPHGHTYHIEVTVHGMIDQDTGFVIDFKELKRILEDGVIARMDHRLINNIPYFAESKKSPTVENMLHYVWGEICDPINTLRPNLAWLKSIRIWETPDSFATLTNGDMSAISVAEEEDLRHRSSYDGESCPCNNYIHKKEKE